VNINHSNLLIWTSDPTGNPLTREILGFSPESGSSDATTALCAMMNKYGSDKGGGWHNYTRLYHHLLHQAQLETRQVFELGLGTNNLDVPSNMGPTGRPGASLRGWREYFPNAHIYGADIDKRILFSEERIKTFYCDQADPNSVGSLWSQVGDVSFDLIIDDGLHEFHANRVFMQNSLEKLARSGLYVVEDVGTTIGTLLQWPEFLSGMPIHWAIVKLPSNTNSTDNCLILVRRRVS
jgi:hypothetical protein